MSRPYQTVILLIMVVVAGCDISDSRPADNRDVGAVIRDLPNHATLVRETRGERVEFVPMRSGDYYLYEVSSQRVIKEGRLYDGQRFLLDPDKNRAYVDGKTVYSEDLKSNRTYRVYFARSDGRYYSSGDFQHVDGRGEYRPDNNNNKPDRDRDKPDRDKPAVDPNTTAKLPKDSLVVASGKGKLEHTAKSDGEFYVYDETAGVIVKDGPMRKGQKLIVDPQADRIFLDGSSISKRNLTATHIHRIQFLKARL